MKDKSDKLVRAAEAYGIGRLQRHIFLCLGPDCCSANEGEKAWKYLKSELKRRKLDSERGGIFRTKAGCLRVCTQGPIAVVYPEGTWYYRMTPERLERVIEEHLVNGNPVQEYAFVHNPLPPALP